MGHELEQIPRDRLVHVLGMILVKGFVAHPDVLLTLVVSGEQFFVDRCLRTDRYGLTRQEYAVIYKKLARKAARMGLPVRPQ